MNATSRQTTITRKSWMQRLTGLLGLGSEHRAGRPARSRKRTRPSLEALEDRLVPANYLLLDFTPDNEGLAPFWNSFTVKNAQGNSPAFLDQDGSGLITNNDVTTAVL